MPKVVVIHRELPEAMALCDRLRRDGIDASPYAYVGPKGFRGIAESPPDAIVIDLMQLPSYGRTMGALLRERKSTRMIPLVFVAGDPAKNQRVRELLPDAVIADLLRLGPAVRRAISRPPAEPAIPVSRVPLCQKLRIREGTVVALLHSPRAFEARLAPLPEGARIQTAMADADVILVFVKSPAGLSRELPALAREMRKGLTLWVCWPKKSGSLAGNLTMLEIRELVQAVGLTDYKSCSLDENWSGVAVARRKG